ncbi:glucan phosphoethanolaminetransferase (alkaline phosphatase superfamily) [Paraburkholderia sp. EB58]|jgi:hypothetical protein|uniref:hypothetical protein n=1 Tax=Paraburkholderia sp. EB58 TaxID=3035125 RepID=UPI003D242DA2
MNLKRPPTAILAILMAFIGLLIFFFFFHLTGRFQQVLSLSMGADVVGIVFCLVLETVFAAIIIERKLAAKLTDIL